jgi:hypothetical protein
MIERQAKIVGGQVIDATAEPRSPASGRAGSSASRIDASARATSSARGFIKKGVRGSDPSVLKDRNVGTCDNRQGTGRG